MSAGIDASSAEGRTLATLWRERAVAIVRVPRAELAVAALEAAVEGGFRVLEVTLGTPDAFAVAARFVRDGLTVGIGTVVTPDEARRAVDVGATFVVSPVVDPEVIRVAGELGAVAIPGCMTPTELHTAWRAGAPLQKLFPAPSPDWLRTVRGPMPYLRAVPTSGTSLENAPRWIEAGAFALGFVSALFDPAEMAAGDVRGVPDRARALLAAARGPARAERHPG